MAVDYYDTQKLRGELDAFDKMLEKLAFTPTAPPPPPMTAMPPQGGVPVGPDGQPVDPAMMQGGAPMDPAAMAQGGAPMDPAMMQQQGAPADPSMQGGAPMDPSAQGGPAPELEGALAELANNTQRMGEEVGAQRDQIDQLTQRLLQMEQQMSALQDGLKSPAPVEAAPEEQPIPGNQL